MNFNNMLIFVTIVLLLVIGTRNIAPAQTPMVKDTSVILTAEGMVAMAINNMVFDSDVKPVAACKCNGTKMVRSGDGLVNVPCQCGAQCVCKKSGSAGTVQPQATVHTTTTYFYPSQKKTEEIPVLFAAEPVDEVKILSLQIIQFTASWCLPCRAFENDPQGGIQLEAKNWYKNGLVKKIDIDKYPALFEKYKQENVVPQFVLIKDGKVIEHITGRPVTDSSGTAANKISSMYMKHYEK